MAIFGEVLTSYMAEMIKTKVESMAIIKNVSTPLIWVILR